jgi:hypothetical protein
MYHVPATSHDQSDLSASRYEAERAFVIEATGVSRSEAIRSALLASADRLRRGRDLVTEVAALEADEADRAEMLSVAALMESVRAPG